MKIKKLAGRCLSLILAGTFLLSNSSALLESVRAADGDDVLQLRFEGGKDRFATIIRGRNVLIRAENTQNYEIKQGDGEQGLTFYYNDDKLTNADKDFSIKPFDEPDKPYDRYEVTSKKEEVNGAIVPSKTTTYVINANYNSMQNAAQTLDQSNRAGTLSLTGDRRIAIGERSVAKLTCSKKPTGELELIFSYDPDTAGYFKRWTSGQAVQVLAGGDRLESVKDEKDGPQTYKIHLGEYDFDFTPGCYYYVDRLDDQGNPVQGPNGEIMQDLKYGLQDGDVITITFDYKKSDDLVLTVLGQMEVLSTVASRAADPNQNVHTADDPEFIRLGKDTDELFFITDNFALRENYTEYDTQMRLSWEFVPDEKGYEDVVKIPDIGTASWKNVTVTPRRNNVQGKLIVKVTYVQDSFFKVPEDRMAEVTREIPITIHGTGDPATVRLTEYTIGQSNVVKPNPDTLPTSTFTMDKYRGGISGYPEPKYPYTATFRIDPGKENGFAREIIINSSKPEALTATIQRGTEESSYEFGSTYKNEGNPLNPNYILLTVYAETPGVTTSLDFQFFIEGGGNTLVEDPRAAASVTISVIDSSPDETAELSELTIRDKKNNRVEMEGFTFSPAEHNYSLDIDYEIESVVMKPTAYQKAQKDIGVFVEYFDDDGKWKEAGDNIWVGKDKFAREWYDDFMDRENGNKDKALPSYKSGQILSSGMEIKLTPGQTVRVTYKVRAENPNVTDQYVIEMTRSLPSDDSTLKSLKFVDEEGTEYVVSLELGKLDYEIRVPYRNKKLQVLPELNHPGAVLNDQSYNPPLKANGLFGSKNWLTTFENTDDMSMLFEINIAAQNGVPDDESHYKITIIREEPSTISTLTTLEVTDVEGNVLTLNPAFTGVLEDENAGYTVSVPYVTDKVRVRVKPDNAYSQIELEYWANNVKRQTLAADALSKPIDVPVMSENAPYYEIKVIVTAESGEPNVTIYKLRIERAEPDTDAHLAGLDLKDLAGEIQYFEDPFDPEVLNYEAIVLYATDKVTVTPTTSSPTATVTVQGRKVESGQPSSNIRLEYPKYTDIEVKVTAQDGETTMTYRIRVKRAEPSTDSRLRALEVSDVDRLKPVFRPKTLEYSANVNEGVTEVTVTATTNDPFATLQIDGKNAVSGQPSEPIVLLDVHQTVTIVVTAQDGKSSTTYTVDLYNTNMVEKSSNADLANLKVIDGLMTPEFAASVTTYEVAVKEDVYSVEIIPTPADPMAKVQVFAGTLEIGDEEGNYSQAIVDGANEFTVRVTAPDESKQKEYKITVYRNEEGKLGRLTPITAEDIDFENSGDIIVVDITKFTRVAADVFNTLKDYPEKTIIFEGNDYSLQFDAADIQKIIPHTEVFDFSLSFSSPYRDEIMSKIRRYEDNDRARIVLVHFGDSKELPAPARFTLSLGRKYRDDQLYWHYWNDERSRIDYYGTVDTNSKGTFAVKLERLGDYIIADRRLAGSEDKSTTLAADGNLSKDTSLMKNNPNTGERGEGE